MPPLAGGCEIQIQCSTGREEAWTTLSDPLDFLVGGDFSCEEDPLPTDAAREEVPLLVVEVEEADVPGLTALLRVLPEDDEGCTPP